MEGKISLMESYSKRQQQGVKYRQQEENLHRDLLDARFSCCLKIWHLFGTPVVLVICLLAGMDTFYSYI
jgi:hypothetical protein